MRGGWVGAGVGEGVGVVVAVGGIVGEAVGCEVEVKVGAGELAVAKGVAVAERVASGVGAEVQAASGLAGGARAAGGAGGGPQPAKPPIASNTARSLGAARRCMGSFTLLDKLEKVAKDLLGHVFVLAVANGGHCVKIIALAWQPGGTTDDFLSNLGVVLGIELYAPHRIVAQMERLYRACLC